MPISAKSFVDSPKTALQNTLTRTNETGSWKSLKLLRSKPKLKSSTTHNKLHSLLRARENDLCNNFLLFQNKAHVLFSPIYTKALSLWFIRKMSSCVILVLCFEIIWDTRETISHFSFSLFDFPIIFSAAWLNFECHSLCTHYEVFIHTFEWEKSE